MRTAHLPAYRQFSYQISAACDVIPAHAEQAAAALGIPFWTTDLDRLLERPDVDVVDLAVHAAQRRPLIERIAAAGKPTLSQKPFALAFDNAREMVEICGRAGVSLMVNQQARWAPAHRALKLVIDSGVLGHIFAVTHVLRQFQDVAGSWLTALEHFNIVDHGIHYIDLSRFFTGRTPEQVRCSTVMVPGQHAVSPMVYSMTLEYSSADHLLTTLHFNNIVQTSALHDHTWFVDGVEGSASVSQTELIVSSHADLLEKRVWTLQGTWFPEAFGGSMGERLLSLAQGREPVTSGRDNLHTLAVTMAAVRSSIERRTVALREIWKNDL
ncbi:MAG: Gfo/Idh/MocA family oxidoreductase [Chloroflexi bacterium]|nr:Gfo/Idh/MocA family oxidoreductase [Chloroflexota bacterium]